jgi:hypothetical protein
MIINPGKNRFALIPIRQIKHPSGSGTTGLCFSLELPMRRDFLQGGFKPRPVTLLLRTNLFSGVLANQTAHGRSPQ